MQFPAYFLLPDGSVKTFFHPVDFAYQTEAGSTFTFPAQVWGLWTAGDWASVCPSWLRLTLVDVPPEFDRATQVCLQKDQSEWSVTPEDLTITVEYTVRQKTADELAAEDAANTPPVPGAVTNFQARAALLEAGLFAQVNDALSALPITAPERQAWEYANEVTRHGTLVNSLAEQLGLPPEQLDGLFRHAATIEA